MVKHVVMWNIQEGLDKKEVIKKVKETLESLVDVIDELKKLEVGFNYNNNQSGHDFILYSEFDSKEDLQAYVVHPAHQKAAEYVKSVVCERVDVDYEI